MDKARNRTRERVSLPTLFEYRNGRSLEDWSTDKRIWLNLIDVTETDNTRKSFSTLPDLTSRLRSGDMIKSEVDMNGNNILELPRECGDEYEKNGVIITDDEGFSSDGDRPLSVTDCEERAERPLPNGERHVVKHLEVNEIKSTASAETPGTERNEKVEKMDSVRQWIEDQSLVNSDIRPFQRDDRNLDKLPEMDIAKKQRTRTRNLSEGSLSLPTKMDYNELLVLSHGLKKTSKNTASIASTSEISSRLLETRQRKTSTLLTTEGFPLQKYDRGEMKVNTHEPDTKIIPLIGAHRRLTRRSSTPFPISEAAHDQYLKDGSSTVLSATVSVNSSKTLLKSINSHSPSSTVCSWPLVNCGSRGLSVNDSPLRMNSSMPRPPPLLMRPASADPLKTNLFP